MAVYRYGKKTSDINVQSDFNIKDTKSDAFIKNRPDSTLSIALDGVEQKKHYNPNTGSETINIDLSDTIIAQDNKLNNAIASLEVSRIGGSGKYISDVSEKDGKISATAVSTASTFSSTSTTAINGVGVNEALKTLNVAEVGSNGKYIQKIKEDNGKISATLKSFDTIISDESTDDNVPTSKAVNTKIFSEINKLNVDEVGEEGKYIEKILENSGKISTVVKAMDTTPTANSKKPVTSGGVKSYVDTQVNTEIANRESAVTTVQTNLTTEIANRKSAIAALDSTSTLTAGNYYTGMTETNGIVTLSQSAMDTIPTANSKKPVTSGGVKSYVDSLNKSLVGEDGSYIKTIKEEKGIVTAVKQQFDTSISSTSDDKNAPTTKAVYDAIQSLGNVFHVRDSVETFSKLPSTGNTAGDVRNVNDTDDNYVWTGTKWDPLGGSSLIDALNYSSPTASGTSTSFITSVSQSKGLITASKSNLPTASTSVVGIVKLNDAVNSTSTTTAATANAVKKVQDSVNTEITNRTTAVSNVQSALTTEIANRKSAVTTVQTNLTTEIENRTTAVKNVQDNLDAEISNRKSAISTEVTNRNTAISTAINALNMTSVGANGSYIKTISENKGIVTATKQAFDTTISSTSTDNNTPTSKAVYTELKKGSSTIEGITGVGLGFTAGQDVYIVDFINKVREKYPRNTTNTIIKCAWADASKVSLVFVQKPTTSSTRVSTSGLTIIGNLISITGSSAWVDMNLILIDSSNVQYRCRITKGDATATIVASLVKVQNQLTIDTAISSTSTNTVQNKIIKSYVDSEISTLKTNLTTAINGKQASGSYKTTQTAVSSPTASGNTTSFIDTISQDTNGKITVTKKTVPAASTSVSGLMSSTDKTKLNGIESGAQVNTVTGVKGNSETSYRTGNINITKGNVGLGNVDNTADKDKNVSSATKLSNTAAIGSATQPVYFSKDGVPVAITYSLGKSVPSDAKFTDTVYTHPSSDGNKHVPANGTTNNGKFLKASATAGQYTWSELENIETLTKTSTVSPIRDTRYYIGTANLTTTINKPSRVGLMITVIANVATTIKYPNNSGTVQTKSMDAGTVFFLFSCGSGYTPNLYGLVLDINPNSVSNGQIYIKTK